MQDKKLITIFLIIIFGIFLIIPCNFILVKMNILTINRDNFSTYIGKNEKNIFDKINNLTLKVENKIENAYTNYFPFYNSINKIYQSINFYSNSLIYNDIPIKTNSNGEYIFFNKEDEFYYLKNNYNNLELDNRIEKQINFFNNISKNINLYIYVPTIYEYTTLKDDNLSNYVNLFQENLNSNINVSVMNIEDINTYKKFYYKTDHHWTIYGAIDAYQSIMSMMGKECINYGDIYEHKERKYYGSITKSASINNVYDYIMDTDVNLEYDVLINGKNKDELFKPRKIRLDRDYIFYDYYISYFNGQYGNVIYDYNNPKEENLLILGDSYTWQIDYLIAASFNKTHVVNLRYDEYKNNKFDLNKYVIDNDIDKVLVLYETGVVLFDQYGYDFEGRVK